MEAFNTQLSHLRLTSTPQLERPASPTSSDYLSDSDFVVPLTYTSQRERTIFATFSDYVSDSDFVDPATVMAEITPTVQANVAEAQPETVNLNSMLHQAVKTESIQTEQLNGVNVAIVGCAHGALADIYASLEKSRINAKWDRVDILLINGDFQAVRNEYDLNAMAVPVKYRDMQDFHMYYSGARRAPVLTMFFGGNHEASNHLLELYYGGWVAPNIYYLGAANVVNFGPLRIAGLSGIWKPYDYKQPHHERLPFSKDDIRSIFHIRELDVRKILQIRTQVDICMTHDWPRKIEYTGNYKKLFRQKDMFEQDSIDGTLGSVAGKLLIDHLRPFYHFAGHLHVLFAGLLKHEDKKAVAPAAVAPAAVAPAAVAPAAVVPAAPGRRAPPASVSPAALGAWATSRNIIAARDAEVLAEGERQMAIKHEKFANDFLDGKVEAPKVTTMNKMPDGTIHEVSTERWSPMLEATVARVRAERKAAADAVLAASVRRAPPTSISPAGLGAWASSRNIIAARDAEVLAEGERQMAIKHEKFANDFLDGKVEAPKITTMNKMADGTIHEVSVERWSPILKAVVARVLAERKAAANAVVNADEIDLNSSDKEEETGAALVNEDEIVLNMSSEDEKPDAKKPKLSSVNAGTKTSPATSDNEEVSAELRALLPASFQAPKAVPAKEEKTGHPAGIYNKETRFLALDKVLPHRQFLRLMKINTGENPDSKKKEVATTAAESTRRPFTLTYDKEWLAILRVFAPEFTLGNKSMPVPRAKTSAEYATLIDAEVAWVESNIFAKNLQVVPANFIPVAPFFNAENMGKINMFDSGVEYPSPQTEAFCNLIGIENKFAMSDEQRAQRAEMGKQVIEKMQTEGGGRGGGGRRGGNGRGRGGFGRGGGGRGGGRGGFGGRGGRGGFGGGRGNGRGGGRGGRRW